jgi:hypothetical protein
MHNYELLGFAVLNNIVNQRNRFNDQYWRD